jgi:simple sugar transport system ATP-binding protein
MPDAALTAPRLRLSGISKRYAGVVANAGVDLCVQPGEIHALLGENGAGKSTLMKIVYGVVHPDEGRIEWEGRPVRIASPAQARALGIGMVFQHFSLFETLSVAENIALALDDGQRPAQLAPRVRELSERYGLPVDPLRLVHGMSVGERQRVEIVRCLLQAPRLLIMDEPTSVLTPQAVRTLFATLRRLAAEGVSILYISHKLDEIRELCDTATVLRGGRVSGTAVPRAETSHSLARLMVGAEIPECRLAPRTPGPIQLELTNLSLPSKEPFGTALSALDLRVRAGEIVGIAGVSGNGQKELMAALSGERRCSDSGAVRICGQPAGLLDPAQRRALGLGFVPEERLGRGAVPAMSLADNALLTGVYGRTGMLRHGLLRRRKAADFAQRAIAAFKVKCGGVDAAAGSLSGGNLQKFIVGREILLEPKVLIAAQPTWGVDVGAAQLIHQALIGLREAGVAVLVVSEELDELFALCDFITVIARGRLSPLRRPAQTSVEEIGTWMAGGFIGDAQGKAQDGVLHVAA